MGWPFPTPERPSTPRGTSAALLGISGTIFTFPLTLPRPYGLLGARSEPVSQITERSHITNKEKIPEEQIEGRPNELANI